MRVLLVEDNEQLAALTAVALRSANFTVDTASTASDARTALANLRYAAIILDLGLPDADGLSVLGDLRRCGSPVPVLVLTARVSVDSRVNALRMGADDYLTKPFAMEELVARLQALMRRPGDLLDRELTLGNLSLDIVSRQVIVLGVAQSFSQRETLLLEIFLSSPGKVIRKDRLEQVLFGLDGNGSANAVEATIHRTRKALQMAGAHLEIHTVRGVGYFITVEKPN